MMYTKEQITDETYRRIAIELLQAQAKYTASYIVEEIARWSDTFISDDGTDYVNSSLDSVRTLMYIQYEGGPEDLIDFLFTTCDEFNEAYANDTISTEHRRRWLYGEPLSCLACDGVCPELSEYIKDI